MIIADIELNEGVEKDFVEWFSESNKTLSKFDGFISRKLLKSPDGSLFIVISHQSKETFVNMHNSPEHDKLHEQGHSYMKREPIRKAFEVIAE